MEQLILTLTCFPLAIFEPSLDQYKIENGLSNITFSQEFVSELSEPDGPSVIEILSNSDTGDRIVAFHDPVQNRSCISLLQK